MEAIGLKLVAGAAATLGLFWDSLFGLIFGFLISAVAQVAFSRAAMTRYLGPNLRGILSATGFGIVASACSYGAAAAARGFYAKGADLRAVFAFMISSTNMNLAILIMFAAMLGWKFAFAEFFGGAIIIAFVVLGATALFRRGELEASAPMGKPEEDGDGHCCHHDDVPEAPRGFAALRQGATWRAVLETATSDVRMLRGELVVGFVVAGFASALIPPEWLAGALRTVGGVPWIGYPLLLVVGLLIAVVTFVCSMGNVPIARYLAVAGIPLGANTTFIYGDLLIPPLIAVYRKSFPPKAVWAFVGLFVVGACLAGAAMDFLIGNALGGFTAPAMTTDLSDRFTLVANALGIVALLAVLVAARRAPAASAVAAAGGESA